MGRTEEPLTEIGKTVTREVQRQNNILSSVLEMIAREQKCEISTWSLEFMEKPVLERRQEPQTVSRGSINYSSPTGVLAAVHVAIWRDLLSRGQLRCEKTRLTTGTRRRSFAQKPHALWEPFLLETTLWAQFPGFLQGTYPRYKSHHTRGSLQYSIPIEYLKFSLQFFQIPTEFTNQGHFITSNTALNLVDITLLSGHQGTNKLGSEQDSNSPEERERKGCVNLLLTGLL